MKILHLFDIFSPYGGGTASLLYNLSKALNQKGHDVTIYTSDFNLDQEYIDSLVGVEVCHFHCVSSVGKFYLTPSIVKEIRKQLNGFDIIHIHSFRSFQNIVAHHYAVKYGIPYVLDTHGSLPKMVAGEVKPKWLLRWVYNIIFGHRILRDAKKVIAETEMGGDEYIKLGANKDKIAVIPPLFDIERFSELPSPSLFRDKYNLKGKHIILFLGRIHRIKGLDFLVQSFYELAKSRNDVILVIAGNDDGYTSSLTGLIQELSISDRVLFVGFLSGDEKLSALVDADVLVQTSIYEYGTGAPFEAILCNTPIIVSKNTNASENVARIDAGYLVEYGNKKELKDTIQHVLENPMEAKRKVKRAREYIKENLSFMKGIERYEQLYIECIAGKEIHHTE